MVFIVFMFLFHNVGPEPIVFMFFSEMFPEAYKYKLNALGYTVNWISNIISVYIFDYFVGGLEFYLFTYYACITMLLGYIGTALAPETFNRSLTEIEQQIKGWRSKKELVAEK